MPLHQHPSSSPASYLWAPHCKETRAAGSRQPCGCTEQVGDVSSWFAGSASFQPSSWALTVNEVKVSGPAVAYLRQVASWQCIRCFLQRRFLLQFFNHMNLLGLKWFLTNGEVKFEISHISIFLSTAFPHSIHRMPHSWSDTQWYFLHYIKSSTAMWSC